VTSATLLCEDLQTAYRIFEGEGLFVGDYRKAQNLARSPSEIITLWCIPPPITQLLCRLIIFGKPIEVRLAQRLFSGEAASIHRTLLGAYNGKPLHSTKLGELTNTALQLHGCPNVHDMRHAREHFSTELAISIADLGKIDSRKVALHLHSIAATSSNHDVKTSKDVYAGVFEKNR
jgi:hypothetical protein